MKVSYELKQGYIDVWNEESEEWDRYIKKEKKSIVEEEKKIPEKLNNFTIAVGSVDESDIEEYIQKLFNQQYEIFNKINDIIDYLKSKGE